MAIRLSITKLKIIKASFHSGYTGVHLCDFHNQTEICMDWDRTHLYLQKYVCFYLLNAYVYSIYATCNIPK